MCLLHYEFSLSLQQEVAVILNTVILNTVRRQKKKIRVHDSDDDNALGEGQSLFTDLYSWGMTIRP